MWIDTASNIDMLFYSPYAHTVASFARKEELTPLTIGLYGSWGAGKSSLLKLIEKDLSNDKNVVCITLNAWQFEGYEDAKIAIMESLLKSLEQNKTFIDSAKDKILALIKKIDYLKLGKDIVSKGTPYALAAITGNPLPIAINLKANLDSVEKLADGFNTLKEKYLSTPQEESFNDSIRKFKDSFEDMLETVTEVNNLVIIVDDLDRCSPDRIIDTLEAIKLFLSVKKTTFIIAVDQRIITYAVNSKYPENGGFNVSDDYIEKIIQLPIKIPELSHKDIENYLLLLICQLHFDNTSLEKFIEKLYEKKLLLSDKALALKDITEIASEIEITYRQDCSNEKMLEDATVISNISVAVSSSLKGNPRQAKRFLNTFFVRKNLANLYFGDEIDLAIMAKLLALEIIDIDAFKNLYEWNLGFNGKIEELSKIETEVSNTGAIEINPRWNNPRIINWLKSEPVELSKHDLSKYFYLSRESISSENNVSASFNAAERQMLSDIINCVKGQEDNRLSDLSNLPSESQQKVVSAVITHFSSDKVGLNIVSRLYESYSDYRQDIENAVKKKPMNYFGPGTIPHLKKMCSVTGANFADILRQLKKDKKISEATYNSVMGVK